MLVATDQPHATASVKSRIGHVITILGTWLKMKVLLQRTCLLPQMVGFYSKASPFWVSYCCEGCESLNDDHLITDAPSGLACCAWALNMVPDLNHGIWYRRSSPALARG